jgi:hypothetical protein
MAGLGVVCGSDWAQIQAELNISHSLRLIATKHIIFMQIRVRFEYPY